MKVKNQYLVGGLIVGGALLLLRRASWEMILSNFLATWEGFREHPYWDVNRYSWGFGTAAPGATGTITRAQAWIEARDHFLNDKYYLERVISRNLTPWQWAALLSLAYNAGAGNADNLATNINSGNDAALHAQWLQYTHDANGKYLQELADRRAAEWRLWTT